MSSFPFAPVTKSSVQGTPQILWHSSIPGLPGSLGTYLLLGNHGNNPEITLIENDSPGLTKKQYFILFSIDALAVFLFSTRPTLDIE